MFEYVQFYFFSIKFDIEVVQVMLVKQGGKLFYFFEVLVVKFFRRDIKKFEFDFVERELFNEVLKFRIKVYVCLYCECEFDNKDFMFKYERQYLIGFKY